MHDLPGTFRITRGCASDYRALAAYHYLAKAPATWAGIWVVRYRPARPTRARSRVVAVAVLSWPAPSSLPREAAMGRLGRFDRTENLRFANRHVRTISRVIVHPQFRSLGLASQLIRWICQRCNTRYVEAFAVMGRAHPMFELAGMTRVELPMTTKPGAARPVYYFFDRKKERMQPHIETCHRNREGPSRRLIYAIRDDTNDRGFRAIAVAHGLSRDELDDLARDEHFRAKLFRQLVDLPVARRRAIETECVRYALRTPYESTIATPRSA